MRRPSPRPGRAAFSEAQLKETIWVNRVGTFGESSAGYWCSRAGALLVRLTHYLTLPFLALWLLLYADDGLATGRGSWFDRALLLRHYVWRFWAPQLNEPRCEGESSSTGLAIAST